MPQEELTWKFFRNGAGSEKIEWKNDFARIMKRWMEEPQAYEKSLATFVAAKHEDDPTVVIKELVDLGNQVAKAELKPLSFPPEGSFIQ